MHNLLMILVNMNILDKLNYILDNYDLYVNKYNKICQINNYISNNYIYYELLNK